MSTGLGILEKLSRSVMDTQHKIWDPEEKLDALNFAVDHLHPHSWVNKETTVTTVAGTHEYNLPTDCIAVYKILMDVGTSTSPRIVHVKGWSVREGSSPKTLIIPIGPAETAVNSVNVRGLTYGDGYFPAGKTTRVLYEALHSQLVADSSTTVTLRQTDEAQVLKRARAELYTNRLNRALFNEREARLYAALAAEDLRQWEKDVFRHRMRHIPVVR